MYTKLSIVYTKLSIVYTKLSIVYTKLSLVLQSHMVDVLVELDRAPNKVQFLNDSSTDRAKLFLQVASEPSERRALIVTASEAVFNLSAEHLHILTNGLQGGAGQ